jgi:hypothetical protein
MEGAAQRRLSEARLPVARSLRPGVPRSAEGVMIPSIVSVAPNMRNNSAPRKWSKLWTDVPHPLDQNGAYTTEQLERMNQEFTAAVERAFRVGGESEMAATATYDLRRR